jgi:NAD(P)-dependent dehydrogenase (short-subunit alcohol dehydrogenase family)
MPDRNRIAGECTAPAALNRLTIALALELFGTAVRVNTIEPRVGVRTEGVDALLGDVLPLEMVEAMDDMVDATLVLCGCPPHVTGGNHVSLDLLGK